MSRSAVLTTFFFQSFLVVVILGLGKNDLAVVLEEIWLISTAVLAILFILRGVTSSLGLRVNWFDRGKTWIECVLATGLGLPRFVNELYTLFTGFTSPHNIILRDTSALVSNALLIVAILFAVLSFFVHLGTVIAHIYQTRFVR